MTVVWWFPCRYLDINSVRTSTAIVLNYDYSRKFIKCIHNPKSSFQLQRTPRHTWPSFIPNIFLNSYAILITGLSTIKVWGQSATTGSNMFINSPPVFATNVKNKWTGMTVGRAGEAANRKAKPISPSCYWA